jgi:hypothetical protein
MNILIYKEQYMIKTISVLATLTLLTACVPRSNSFDKNDYFTSESMFETICLDGVEYWIRAAHHRSYLAPRIDPKTMMPVACRAR